MLLFTIVTAACGAPSIEALCEDTSQAYCATCTSCGPTAGDGSTIGAEELCGMPSDPGECEAAAHSRCVDQAAILERPKAAIEACTDDLETLQCGALTEAWSQGRSAIPESCSHFL